MESCLKIGRQKITPPNLHTTNTNAQFYIKYQPRIDLTPAHTRFKRWISRLKNFTFFRNGKIKLWSFDNDPDKNKWWQPETWKVLRSHCADFTAYKINSLNFERFKYWQFQKKNRAFLFLDTSGNNCTKSPISDRKLPFWMFFYLYRYIQEMESWFSFLWRNNYGKL